MRDGVPKKVLSTLMAIVLAAGLNPATALANEPGGASTDGLSAANSQALFSAGDSSVLRPINDQTNACCGQLLARAMALKSEALFSAGTSQA